MTQQLLLNGLIVAAVYALVGIGFALVYRTAGFLHFAHGALFTIGPYSLYVYGRLLGLAFPLSLLLAVVSSVLAGCVIEICVYRSLRRKHASPLTLLLASLGTYVVIQNAISFAFGDDTKMIRAGIVLRGINLLGARITPIQITTICVGIVLTIAVALWLRMTRLGRAIRAVADHPELASVCGIDSNRVILWVVAMGSALAGIAGILVALDVDMTPTMGLSALMMGVVVVIIGGMSSIPGLALGALLLGLAQSFGVWKIGSEWQNAIAFAILLAFLILKPEGFLGRRIRKATP